VMKLDFQLYFGLGRQTRLSPDEFSSTLSLIHAHLWSSSSSRTISRDDLREISPDLARCEIGRRDVVVRCSDGRGGGDVSGVFGCVIDAAQQRLVDADDGR